MPGPFYRTLLPSLLEVLRMGGTMALVALPGWIVARVFLLPGKKGASGLALGGAAGLALAVFVATLCAQYRLSLFFVLWPLGAVAALVAGWRQLREFRPAPVGAGTLPLAGGILLTAIPLLIAAAAQRFPHGFDPTCHLLLAQKLRILGHTFGDWLPFEAIPLHYPLGSHVLLVVLSSISGLSLERAYVMLQLVLALFTVLQVHQLARAAYGAETAAVAAIAYGVVAAAGGAVDYAGWGGLPNELAMCFLLGALQLVLEDDRGWQAACLLAILLAGIALTHHLSLMVAALVLSVVALVRLRTPMRWLIPAGAGGGALLAAFFLVPQMLHAREVSQTGALIYEDVFYGPYQLIIAFGPGFAVLVTAGLVLAAWRRDARPPTPLAAALMSLAVVFVFCEYVWRLFVRPGEENLGYAPLTAGRVLIDATPLLAPFAGLAVVRLRTLLRIPAGASLVLIPLLGASNLPAWHALTEDGLRPPPDVLAVCDWIRRTTPADTLVMTRDPWIPYLTWRTVRETPIPASETAPWTTEKERWMRSIEAGTIPAAFSHTPILDIRRAGDERGLPVVFHTGRFVVVMISSGR